MTFEYRLAAGADGGHFSCQEASQRLQSVVYNLRLLKDAEARAHAVKCRRSILLNIHWSSELQLPITGRDLYLSFISLHLLVSQHARLLDG